MPADTKLSRAASTTAFVTWSNGVDFENSFHLREHTVEQPKIAARDSELTRPHRPCSHMANIPSFAA
jgi:hypothetical protein